MSMSTIATFRRRHHQSHTMMRHRRRPCRHDNNHHQNQHHRPSSHHTSPSLTTTRPSSSSSLSSSRKPTMPWIQFHQLVLVMPVLLQLLLAVCHAQSSSSSLTWEISNDPDHLCANSDGSSKITGYKATLDCRGYVYCSDGYLMGGGIGNGGSSNAAASSSSSDPAATTTTTTNNNSTTSGIISCWPNQLFDEINGVCTYWQNVDTSNCPEFDSAKMMLGVGRQAGQPPCTTTLGPPHRLAWLPSRSRPKPHHWPLHHPLPGLSCLAAKQTNLAAPPLAHPSPCLAAKQAKAHALL